MNLQNKIELQIEILQTLNTRWILHRKTQDELDRPLFTNALKDIIFAQEENIEAENEAEKVLKRPLTQEIGYNEFMEAESAMYGENL